MTGTRQLAADALRAVREIEALTQNGAGRLIEQHARDATLRRLAREGRVELLGVYAFDLGLDELWPVLVVRLERREFARILACVIPGRGATEAWRVRRLDELPEDARAMRGAAHA